MRAWHETRPRLQRSLLSPMIQSSEPCPSGPRPVKVLLVGCGPDCLQALRALFTGFEADYALDCASDFEAGLRALRLSQPEVCVADCRLGGRSGLELIEEARRQGLHVPVILIGETAGPEEEIRSIRAGAADFLVKNSLRPGMLDRAVRHAHARGEAGTALVILDQQLRRSQTMEAVGQLSAGVAHDFNNILTIIEGHAALLANGYP
jgi:DNA-binding NtrC family response regulator